MTARSTRLEFRDLLQPGAAAVLPGVANALAARVVADLGFPAAYVTGAGIANTYLGIPDNGLVTLSELCDHVAAIRDVFPGPIMVDADTGFGNALNMTRTVKMLERAGADAIQIEDQVFPKRCGHFDGKETIPKAEMVAKVKAAADARTDLDLIIVARTDAIATDGFEAAIDRAAAYREAGADVTFIEAPQTPEQIAAIGKLPWPQIINIVLGGRTPELPNDKLKAAGLRRRALRQSGAAGLDPRHAARARHVAPERRRSATRRCWRSISPSASGWSTRRRGTRWRRNTRYDAAIAVSASHLPIIYFTLPKSDEAWLNGSLTSEWRGLMLNQSAAQQERKLGVGVWFGSLVDRFLDYIDELGGSIGLPTCVEELYGQPVKVEAPIDRLGR